ncbi:DUF4783 domain-containing protein [Aquiflexum gelatinilyticum]|uniref:DUF4783 domain-containing protein n=1 Tax=Aquiflexum gelatinilyticum TaxID=2961943 RepID=A0A9X2P6F6_9BACT|nr:DUF4783 domain-containing protein [Aquiflexum gelatinilyticum]MCR9014550.1 DUF4783 domain-containing protein [Aquiflexum gelatinilyticum]
MKNLPFLFVFLFAIIWFSEANEVRNNTLTINDVFTYFRSGSSKEIARYFDQTVLLNINGKNGDYSKSQAEYILRDFFLKYPPLDFNVLHQAGSPGPTIFYVGSYQSKGEQFRVLIKGNSKSEVLRIFSIDIIKTKI